MKLILSTPLKRSEYSIAWLEINTPTGNYVIQNGHAPTILILSRKQPLTFRLKTGKKETLFVKHGVVKIDRTSATVVMMATEE